MTVKPRDPVCKARRPGTSAGYRTDNCRCVDCTRAHTLKWKQRQHARRAGIPALVDAQPVRDHVNWLRGQGMGLRSIKARSGVAQTVIQTLLWPRAGNPPTRRMRPSNANAILALQPDPLPCANVAAHGTRLRLQALQSLGWSSERIGEVVGVSRNAIFRALKADSVRQSTKTAVAAAYEQLWDQQPPNETKGQRISAARTRERAARAKWLPPMALDDDRIDDPTYEPWKPPKPGPTPWAHQPCGSHAAYRRHQRRGEHCNTCRSAENRRRADRRARAERRAA